MHILRRAFAAAGAADPVENVHGLGYRLVSDTSS
jgi:DNA-binding winged helix-turn-helix (wHTH) protein